MTLQTTDFHRTPAAVPGLFDQFQPAYSLNLVPSAHDASMSARLSVVVGPERAEQIGKKVAEDRDNWGGRLRVVEARMKGEGLAAAVETFYFKSRSLVGVSNVRVDNGVIVGEVHPTPMVVYRLLSTAGAPEEVLSLSAVFGTSGVLCAEYEGSEWIQVQARNRDRNFPHGGNLGCSPAGFFRYNYVTEGTLEEKAAQIISDPASLPLKPVGTKEAAGNLIGEAREELGIYDRSTLQVTIIGLAHELPSPHFEILTEVESTQTVEEINQQAEKKIQTIRKAGQETLHPHDFTEAFSWIPRTPEAIKALVLTSPHSPATHIANFIAEGRKLIREREGERAASLWQAELISELCTAWENTGRKVSDFYSNNPAAFFENLHTQEKRPIDTFITSNTLDSATMHEHIRKAARMGNTIAQRVQSHLGRLQHSSDRLISIAYAMVQGIIHTPSDDTYDPRRVPEAQGLPSAKECFEILRKSGIEVLPGTMGSA